MSSKRIDPLLQEVGKTIASERFLNTMDGFWFALKPNIIINSFDFVTVENLFNSKSIGIIKELQQLLNMIIIITMIYLITVQNQVQKTNRRKKKKKRTDFLIYNQMELFWQKLQ